MVFAGSGPAHLAFLRDEVVPVALPRVPHVVIADVDAFAYEDHRSGARGPLDDLPTLLNDWLGEELVLPSGLDGLAHPLWNTDFAQRGRKVKAEIVDELSATPLRLWEAFLLRGHAYRWELVRGEVPLIGEFPTTLLANRSLMQCVKDAEALERVTATEAEGWIHAGRYRFRQQGRLLDIRVRMTPADVRVAFLPAHHGPGSDDLPTLAGVMLAGGPKGKTEMIDGYTDSTVLCQTPDEAERLAASLRATLLERCGVPEVWIGPESDAWRRPPCGSAIWTVTYDDRYVTLETPTFHDGLSPLFDTLHGDFWEYDPAPPVAFLDRYERDPAEKAAKEVAEAFAKGSRQVWLADHGASAQVTVYRSPDASEVYGPAEVMPAPDGLSRDVPVSALVRVKRDAEMLQMVLRRQVRKAQKS